MNPGACARTQTHRAVYEISSNWIVHERTLGERGGGDAAVSKGRRNEYFKWNNAINGGFFFKVSNVH